MSPYSQSLDVTRVQRRLRRVARSDVVVRAWSRWGDPLLAAAVLALMAWAIVEGHTASPAAGTVQTAVVEDRGGSLSPERFP